MLRSQNNILIDGYYEESEPFLDDYWGENPADTSRRFIYSYKIPASATDYDITIPVAAGTKEVIFSDFNRSTDLTVKVNGESVALPIKPILILNNPVWRIRVSNASSTSARMLNIYVLTNYQGSSVVTRVLPEDGYTRITANGSIRILYND